MRAPATKTVLIAAGGTGGHLFPAQALAGELKRRAWRVELATDHRVRDYGADFPAEAVHVVPSATPSGGGILARALAILRLIIGTLSAGSLVRRVKPAAAVGFGGYPTVPPILAASHARVPTVIHEANAVLGRANKFLAPRVTAIATSAPRMAVRKSDAAKVVETGNPVRPTVIEAAKTPYPARRAEDPFRLLVFGGSQGARVFSEVLPVALETLDGAHLAKLEIVQQCRAEDLETVRGIYHRLHVVHAVAPFFKDLPQKIAESHLVVARSGASTVAELGVIGRPSILVPLPGAIDQDQKANAAAMVALGGAVLIEQKDLGPQRLADEIVSAMMNPGHLFMAAEKARRFGRPDAAARLADLVERVAAGASVRA